MQYYVDDFHTGPTMMTKTVPPALDLDSFSCPHCGALAHQYWQRIFIKALPRGQKPVVVTPNTFERLLATNSTSENEWARIVSFNEALSKNAVTFRALRRTEDIDREMVNVAASRCHSCDGFSLWACGVIIYPSTNSEFVPADDMPSDVKQDFIEAGEIYGKSPRGSAALLRLCLQKLMRHLGQTGENLNEDIRELVSKGLNSTIQQALDVVRVIGNNAVHPGTIDLRDTPEVAAKLFAIVNLIVQTMISTPNQVSHLFEGLPDGAKKAIERRDGKS